MKKIVSSKTFAVASGVAALFVLVAVCVSSAFTAQGKAGAVTAAPDASKPKNDIYQELELFADAVSAVRSDYVDEIDSKKLVYGALHGMLASLDDFSEFMDPEEYKEITVETSGQFGGIGVEINMRDGLLTVIAPIAGSPADKAAVMAGDRIVKINGRITKKMNLDDAVKELRGDAGTEVKLTLWREKQDAILDVVVKRAIIKIDSIKKAAILEDKIGYIRLVEFQEKTPRDLDEALGRITKEGFDALILDLRNNPGGLLDVAVSVSEKFLPKGALIVSTKARLPQQNIEFKSKGASPYTGFPLVVMINEGSASASEIVAGAVQDNKRGIIVGTKSFGKGSVQTVMPLSDGSALRLTTASYYTPSGRSIRGEGIIPDVVVDQEVCQTAPSAKVDIFKKLEAGEKGKDAKEPVPDEGVSREDRREGGRDPQLERALDIIKGIKAYQAVLKGYVAR